MKTSWQLSINTYYTYTLFNGELGYCLLSFPLHIIFQRTHSGFVLALRSRIFNYSKCESSRDNGNSMAFLCLSVSLFFDDKGEQKKNSKANITPLV